MDGHNGNSKGVEGLKSQIFKRKYEARLEFQEGLGWGLKLKNHLWERYGYSLEQVIILRMKEKRKVSPPLPPRVILYKIR